MLAEEGFIQEGDGDDHQGPECEAPLQEQGSQDGEWVSGQHFVREQQGLRLEVPVVAACGTLWEGEEVFPDLEPGRQEEVVHGELLQAEKEHEVVLRAESEEQGEEQQLCQGERIAGQQIVLDGEDLLKAVEMQGKGQPESEVEAKPQEEKCEVVEQAESGQAGKCTLSPLEVLQALQSEMEPVNEHARRAVCRLKRRTWQRCRPYLELRNSHIEHIPGFWAKAVSLTLECVVHPVTVRVQQKGISEDHSEGN